MSSKPQKKNAFMFFVEDYKRRLKINKPMPEIISQVHGTWESMSQAEKEPYVEMSKEWKKYLEVLKSSEYDSGAYDN